MRRVPRISSLVGMPGPLFAIVWYAAAIILATGLTGCRIVGNHDNGVDITSIPRTGVISGKITASQALPLLSLRATVRADFDVDHAYVWLVENNLLAAYTDASGAFFISEVPLTATAGFHVVARFEVGEGNERKTYKIKSGEVSVKQDEPEQDAGTLELMIADKRVHGVLCGSDGSPIRNARLELWGESFQTGPNGEFETPPLPDLDVPIEKIEIKEALGFKPTSILATFDGNAESVLDIELDADDGQGGEHGGEHGGGSNDGPNGGSPNKNPRVFLHCETPADTVVQPGSIVKMWSVLYFSDYSDGSTLRDEWKAKAGAIASASDPLPDAVRQTIRSLIPELDFSKARVVSAHWTAPSEAGEYWVKAYCSKPDGESRHHDQKKLKVNSGATPPSPETNTPPAVTIAGPNSAQSGKPATFAASASDAQGDPVSYAWTVSPAAGAYSRGDGQTFVWTAPMATGPYRISCAVVEIFQAPPLSANASWSVLVTPGPIIVEPGKISGHLIDDQTSAPIGGALVIIAGTSTATTTDDSGYFEIKGLIPGTYDLVATRNGYKGKTFPGIVVP